MPESHAAPVESEAPESWADLDDAPPVEADDADAPAGDAEDAAEVDTDLPPADDADASPEDDADSPPSAGDRDAGDADRDPAADDAAPPTDDAPAPDATPADDATPFSFTVDGTEIEVDGATVGDDGTIRVPQAVWQRQIRPHLANRRAWMEERRRLTQQAEQAGEAHKGELETWQQIGQALEAVLSAPDEELIQKIAALKRQWPQLKLQAKEAALEDREKQFTSTRETEQRQQQMEQLRPELETHLGRAIEQVAQDAFADTTFDEQARERIRTKLMRHWRSGLFFQADEAQAAEYGVQPGTLMVRTDWIEDELRDRAEIMAAARKRKRAEEKNRKALGEDKKKPDAPAVSAKGGAAPTKDAKEPESYDEWVASL